MRIILSRKGMDSQYGRLPSPIIDRRFVMLPIPTDENTTKYAGIAACGGNMERLVKDLSGGKFALGQAAHLDPDLDPASLTREAGWSPTFGQVHAAATHLKKHGVTVGDLFLFFGWVRPAAKHNGTFAYADEPGFHALFGWLQVGAVVDCQEFNYESLSWAMKHPHFAGGYGTAYIASDKLKLSKRDMGLPGAGIFQWCPQLRLTEPGQPNRSVWKMPNWFIPRDGVFPMTYHETADRYIQCANYVRVQSVAKGQEFVIHTDRYPETIKWAAGLILAGNN